MSTPQSSYIGRHAELYDLLYAEKPYAAEAAFVHRCLQSFRPGANRLLELACGTGNHAFLLEERGYDIIAIDYSADMLARAQAKARSRRSQVDFRQQDMRSLDIAERPFDAIICLFDSLGYAETNDNIIQILSRVHEHLSPGGIFLFEFWHAGAMVRSYDPVRVRRIRTPDGRLERISETRIDYSKQVCFVSYTINELHDDGTYQSLQETQVNRFFLLQEMALFLAQAGLTPLKWFSGFQEDEHITGETWHVIGVARKDGGSK